MIANKLESFNFMLYRDLGLDKLSRIEKLLSNPYDSTNPLILLKTIEELQPIERNLRAYLENDLPSNFPKLRSKFSILKFEIPKDKQFNTEYLDNEISSFLVALSDFQKVFGMIKGEKQRELELISIVRNNPFTINFKSGFDEFIKFLLDHIIPWRREILKRKKEIEVRKGELEIERLEFELEGQKIKQAIDIINTLKKDVGQVEITRYTTLLMEPLERILDSDMNFIEIDDKP